MATFKVQREFMPALDKHCLIFTVLLGRVAGTVRCWAVCCTHRSPEEEFSRTQKGSGAGICTFQTEARNADADPHGCNKSEEHFLIHVLATSILRIHICFCKRKLQWTEWSRQIIWLEQTCLLKFVSLHFHSTVFLPDTVGGTNFKLTAIATLGSLVSEVEKTTT